MPRPRLTRRQRFWSLVDRRGRTQCWPWLGARNHDGYGRCRVAGRRLVAHRYAYELVKGPIPPGLAVDHLCRNPICVNPAHLEPVTRAENTRRGNVARSVGAQRSNRLPEPGEITMRQREILGMTAEGLSYGEIALALAISPATVKAHVVDAYRRLRVGGRADAWRALGWLLPPDAAV